MATVRNPFTPAFGTMPFILAGRDELVDSMRDAFSSGPGDPYLSSIFIGARGTGKTVLLSRVRELAAEAGWIAVSTTALPGMLEDLYEQACLAGSHIVEGDMGARLTSLTVGPLSASWERSAAHGGNWRTRMTALLDQLDAYGMGLVITVDEVDAGQQEMLLLSAVFQHFVTEHRRVALVMAGLPFHVHRLLAEKSVSFLRRSMQFDLARIPDVDVESALVETFEAADRSLTPGAAEACVKAIEGFPYMLQLVGYRVWKAGGNDALIGEKEAARGIAEARREVEERILAATYRELSPGDIRFIKAMLADPNESRMSDIARRMGEKYNYAANYKRRLLAQGVIGEPATGVVRFEIPGFKDYVRKQ